MMDLWYPKDAFSSTLALCHLAHFAKKLLPVSIFSAAWCHSVWFCRYQPRTCKRSFLPDNFVNVTHIFMFYVMTKDQIVASMITLQGFCEILSVIIVNRCAVFFRYRSFIILKGKIILLWSVPHKQTKHLISLKSINLLIHLDQM